MTVLTVSCIPLKRHQMGIDLTNLALMTLATRVKSALDMVALYDQDLAWSTEVVCLMSELGKYAPNY